MNLSSQSHPNSPILFPVPDSRNPIELKIAQISEQLSPLKIGSANKEAEMEKLSSELKSIKKIFSSLANDVKDIQSMKNLYNDVAAVKFQLQEEVSKLHQSILSLHGALNSCNTSVQQNSSQILELSRSGSSSSKEVSEMSIFFTGNPKETKRFIYFAKERLNDKADWFKTEKSKINWIVRHFRYPNNQSGENCPSYNWWMALLFENARTQNLPTDTASVEDPYVLDCLQSAKNFLSHLDEVFDNKHDNEDAKKKLFSFRQGNRTIEEFNAIFNSLCYAVNLTDESRCDVYERALNPKVLKVAVLRGDWKAATSLKDKQSLAVAAAEAQEKLSSIDSGNLPVVQSRQHSQPPPKFPPPPPPPPRTSDGPSPMDLDNLLADNQFSFGKFRCICFEKHLCQRCGRSFDKNHRESKGCPLPEAQHIDVNQKASLYKKWLSEGGPTVVRGLARASEEEKKSKDARLNANEAEIVPLEPPSASVPLDQIPPLSLGDLCWQHAIDEMELDTSDI